LEFTVPESFAPCRVRHGHAVPCMSQYGRHDTETRRNILECLTPEFLLMHGRTICYAQAASLAWLCLG
jgi:hypothetical protein